jgi:hypoxanthine phosphoribosyltransferase
MTTKRYLSYDDLQGMVNSMIRQMAIDGYKPDVVVGLVRGGMIPAVHVSHYYDVPLVAFKYSLRDHPGKDDISKLVELMDGERKILIVDDICDAGHTLRDVRAAACNFLSPGVPAEAEALYDMLVKTAVLQYNTGARLYMPSYFGEVINKVEKPEWIVYPFEYD